MEKPRLVILAFDDDPGDLILLRRHLEEIRGFRIVFRGFSVLEEGLLALRNQSADLVFVDYELGRSTGTDLCERIRRAGLRCPIVMLTGRESSKVASEARKAGIADFLAKGAMSSDSLERCIGRALRNRADGRQSRTVPGQRPNSERLFGDDHSGNPAQVT